MPRVDLRSRRFLIPAAVIVVVVGLFAYRVIEAGADRPAAASIEQIRAERGVPVTVTAAVAAPLAVWREYNGNVAGAREAVVGARTGDPVSAVLVAAGQRVRAGQVLVRQSGETTAARARQAEAARGQAQRTVERLRPLHEAGAISDQEWEQAVTQLELAAADVAAAHGMLAVTSPLAGTVTEVMARPGMVPSAGDPLVRVADLSRLVVFVRMSAAEAAAVGVGQRARAGLSAEGAVNRVALQADPATRLVEVEVGFPPTAGLIPGTLAPVRIEVATRAAAVQVPRAAVRDDAVWVVTELGRAARRHVQTGLVDRDIVEIISGVEAGEQVVVDGGSLLSEGALVRVVNSTAGGAGDV
jgi:membrane fusion protein, multidrug efflux system